MNKEQQQQIRQRCGAATEDKYRYSWTCVPGGIDNFVHIGDSDCWVPTKEDAAFIAHARQDIPALLDEIERLELASVQWVFCPKCKHGVSSADTMDGFHDCGAKTIPMWSEERRKNCRLQEENTRLRGALEGSSRIVEKYKDACMEWAKESHHNGKRQDKEFWERRAKSMANLLVMISQALTPKEQDETKET